MTPGEPCDFCPAGHYLYVAFFYLLDFVRHTQFSFSLLSLSLIINVFLSLSLSSDNGQCKQCPAAQFQSGPNVNNSSSCDLCPAGLSSDGIKKQIIPCNKYRQLTLVFFLSMSSWCECMYPVSSWIPYLRSWSSVSQMPRRIHQLFHGEDSLVSAEPTPLVTLFG